MDSRYIEEIKKNERLLFTVEAVLVELDKMYSNNKNARKISEQLHIFYKFLENASTRSVKKYRDKTEKNMAKIDDRLTYIESQNLENALKGHYRKFDSAEIRSVMSVVEKSFSLVDIVNNLSNYYIQILNNINKNMIEYEKRKASNEETKRTIELEKENKEVISYEKENVITKQIDFNAEQIINGPKKRTFVEMLRREDIDIKDMNYLYGLALDILIIMEKNQQVKVRQNSLSDRECIDNVSFPYVDDMNAKMQQIYSKYGVGSIDELLNKYEQIRNAYYKNYQMLKTEQKVNYAFSKFEIYKIPSSLGTLFGPLALALKNEDLSFPPSKNELINMINRRILNGKNFELVEPKHNNDGVRTAEPMSEEEYYVALEYYKNLTKNMTVEEVAKFYSAVIRDLDSRAIYIENNVEDYYSVMQKLFCEVIFQKNGMKYLDKKKYEEELDRIAETILKEKLKFSIYGHDKVTEKEKEERAETIYAEYLKYLASLENKNEVMRFSEFVKTKYGLQNVEELENYYNELSDRGRR